MSQRGLSGMFLLIKTKPTRPIRPTANKYRHLSVSPMPRLIRDAMQAPKCQVPSIIMLDLPLILGGKNSSTAVKMAVN